MLANSRVATAAATLAAVLSATALGCASLEAARLYQTGSQALDSGETDRAIRELEQAAELLPEASEIQNHLGIAYLNAGRDSDAAQAFRRAADLDCTNAAAVRNLRVVEARTGPEPPTR